MICCNIVDPVCNYGANACYCTCPTDDQIAAGVFPLDSLPAGWWNWMWSKTNASVNQARTAVGAFINEFNTVLTEGNVTPNCNCVDQLYRAINNIRQRVGNAATAGSVKSSSNPSAVAIDENGYMTVNCLGNAASLSTSAHTVVGAINELNSTFSSCISSINTCTATLGSTKAPTNHASANTTYGVGSATAYGHVKVSDVYSSCVGGATEAIAASQKAVYDMYTAIMAAGFVTLGNTVGCALGTASAGSATTAARSDHVHPIPTSIECASKIILGCNSVASAFTWYGYDTQPTWLWGSDDDPSGSYLYNPSCFHVACADRATNATNATCATNADNATCATNATYATCAGNATTATNSATATNALCASKIILGCNSVASAFTWYGYDTQPTWLWGNDNDPSSSYLYNPSCFHVACADCASKIILDCINTTSAFAWYGYNAQPTWVWGNENDSTKTYLYNPSCFHVACADNATNATNATNAGIASQLQATYVTNISSAGVWRDGNTLYNNSGHIIFYFSDDVNEQVFSLFSGQSTAIGSGGNYYYVTLG